MSCHALSSVSLYSKELHKGCLWQIRTHRLCSQTSHVSLNQYAIQIAMPSTQRTNTHTTHRTEPHPCRRAQSSSGRNWKQDFILTQLLPQRLSFIKASQIKPFAKSFQAKVTRMLAVTTTQWNAQSLNTDRKNSSVFNSKPYTFICNALKPEHLHTITSNSKNKTASISENDLATDTHTYADIYTDTQTDRDTHIYIIPTGTHKYTHCLVIKHSSLGTQWLRFRSMMHPDFNPGPVSNQLITSPRHSADVSLYLHTYLASNLWESHKGAKFWLSSRTKKVPLNTGWKCSFHCLCGRSMYYFQSRLFQK